jgi:hypothetical protein
MHKDFQIFSFASDSTMVVVLLQKNDDGLEQPIAFMSKALQGAELNYKPMEKQAYALVKGLAHFRPYFWNSRIIAYVPHPMVKDILVQKDCNGTRGRWITKIQEYDLEVRPTKLVRGQGLAKLMEEKNLEVVEDQQVSSQVNLLTDPFKNFDWYQDIILYLTNLSYPPNFTKTQRRSLQLHAAKYCFWQGRLGWRNPEGVILRCVDLDESKELLKELHSGVCGGHFSARTTAHKIMRTGYYWPTLFRDAHSYV